jgi:hypothetical protein
MMFAQQRNCLKTHFSERVPVVKRRIYMYISRLNDEVGRMKVSDVFTYAMYEYLTFC